MFLLEASDPLTEEPIETAETLTPYTTERQMRQAASRLINDYRANVDVITGLYVIPGIGIVGVPCYVPLSQY